MRFWGTEVVSGQLLFLLFELYDLLIKLLYIKTVLGIISLAMGGDRSKQAKHFSYLTPSVELNCFACKYFSYLHFFLCLKNLYLYLSCHQ